MPVIIITIDWKTSMLNSQVKLKITTIHIMYNDDDDNNSLVACLTWCKTTTMIKCNRHSFRLLDMIKGY